ncbi:MAG: hypothetical protein ABI425_01000 [Patescibacteria group bacterium]
MKEKISVVVLFFVLLLLKLYFIGHNDVFFFFDQSRDAFVSRQIFEKGDLKLQGPSASGTNDTVYHGVLYYYVIGPIYTIFNGNPFYVDVTLAFLTTFNLVVFYLLVKKFSASKVAAFIASVMLAVSFDGIVTNTWLSNPILTYSLLILFYYSLWRFVSERSTFYFYLTALFLGLANQSLISTIYLWGVTMVSIALVFWLDRRHQVKTLSLKKLFLFFTLYLFCVSTILLTQFKLARAGIFTLEALSKASSEKQASVFTCSVSTLLALSRKVNNSFFPQYYYASVLTFIAILAIFIRKNSKKKILFVLLWLSSPFWLTLLHDRDSYHIFIGIEACIYLVTGVALSAFTRTKLGLLGVAIFLIIIILSQLQAIMHAKSEKTTQFWVERGALLSDELALIDKTYQLANGRQFTISTATNPYLINTTWSYLYDWYGKGKYNYLPLWYGNAQVDVPGAELLTKVEEPAELHFTIKEAEPGVQDWMKKELDQSFEDRLGPAKENFYFGKLELSEFQNTK